jgi:glucosamine 6-phosphate synthetase-like amidotransferase/phosphosugar isomerase protein
MVRGLLQLEKSALEGIEKILLIGCGTSWHAARMAEFFFESIAHIPATAVLASEFRYKTFFPSSKAMYIFVSQSGETADTKKFAADLESKAIEEKILAEFKEGVSLGVQGTPTFYINGKKVENNPRNLADFNALIREAAK